MGPNQHHTTRRMNYPIDNVCFYDLEVYPRWFLTGFKLGDVYYQYANDLRSIRDMINWLRHQGVTLVGFNSSRYDDPVLTRYLETGDPDEAQRVSVSIIQDNVSPWSFDNTVESIDLMPVLPGQMSLKKIGVCLGHAKLQELPVPWDQVPTLEQQEILSTYNRNDLDITEKLYRTLLPELELRASMSEQYEVDLRSKGEATIAELILQHERKRLGAFDSRRELNDLAREYVDKEPYAVVSRPTWWDVLTHTLPTVRSIGEEIFKARIPIENDRLQKGFLDRRVFIGDRYYQMGAGGLHSIDGPGAWTPEDGEFLCDIDVASYYPNIILTQNLSPRAWGDKFLTIYRTIVERRLAAKRAGDKTTADVLKIAANGTYGKSSDPFSSLYDPCLTANVTVLGQLGLLALIEMLDGVVNVVSANTDGITVLGRDRQSMETIVQQWEEATGLVMEFTDYEGLYQKDVNNYLAVTTAGKVKQKGEFIDEWPDLRHTPSANIVATAVTRYLSEGTPVEETVRSCRDINQFILTQTVGGNFTTAWNNRALGKVLRFYKSTLPMAAPIIRTPGDGDKGKQGVVSDSDSCVPLEDLPDYFPDDVDVDWYVARALKLLDLVTRPKRRGMNRWAEVLSRLGMTPCMVDPEARRSRAGVAYGQTDFSSLPYAWALGTGTGEDLLAKVTPEHTEILSVQGKYPSKTRKKVTEDHGFELVFGARVPLGSGPYAVNYTHDESELETYYTPAEWKKVRAV